MTVSTGMIGEDRFITGITIIHVPPYDGCPACFNIVHGLFMAGEHLLAVLLPVGRAVFPENVREFE
jgi:hypothetical protein